MRTRERSTKHAVWSLAVALSVTVVIAAGAAAATGPGGWADLEDGAAANASVLNGAVYAMAYGSSDSVIVGGNFTFKPKGGGDASHLAVWHRTGYWSAFEGTPLNGDVHAIAWDGDHAKLYVGGTFTNAGGNPGADYLAVWDAGKNDWMPFCSPAPAFGGSVAALQIVGSTLYVGGSFQNGAGIASADYLLACDLNTGASRSMALRDGDITGGVYALTADSRGTLYAGGQFINMAGIPEGDHVASFDGIWHALGVGVTDYVRSLASNGTDVFIGTDSVNVAGIPQADHVVRWNGSSWSALGANRAGTDGWLPQQAFIYALAVKGSQVVATGSFQNADGTGAADHIAIFHENTWYALGANGAGDGPWIGNGLAALILPDGDIFAGGNFTSAGGDSHASFIAHFNLFVARPSNVFTIGAIGYVVSTGAAHVVARTSAPGLLIVSGPGVRRVQVAAPSGVAGVILTVHAAGKQQRVLDRLGHVTVKATVAYTPTGGTVATHLVTLALKKH
jgi:Rax2 C-terminal beta propeller domain